MEQVIDRSETSTANSHIKRKRRLYTCLQRISRITMLLSIIFIVFLYLSEGDGFHEKQITREAGPPGRFFPSHSHVSDYPYGSLQSVIKLLQDEELIFVMYYAPWCAQSVRVRGEFIHAAKVLSSVVKFVGINCWFPTGECRQRMKFLSYPEMFVYHTGVMEGYRFTGIKEAEYLIKFAESFLYPLHSLHSLQEINEFSVKSDTSVIGYFDFNSSPQPPGTAFQPPGPAFHQFYLAALRVASYDFYQPIRFGVVQTLQLAKVLGLSTPGRFVLARVGNTTLKYPLQSNMTCKNISSWIMLNKQKNLSPWLVPPGTKSLTLSVPMQRGPAVFVFAPTNPLTGINPYFDMVRLASLAYRSCGENAKYFHDIMLAYIQATQSSHHHANQLHSKCLNNRSSSPSPSSSTPSSSPSSSSTNRASIYTKCCVSLSIDSNGVPIGSKRAPIGSNKAPSGGSNRAPSGSNRAATNTKSSEASSSSICEYCVQKKSTNTETICDINLLPEVNSDLPTSQLNSCSNVYQFYNVNEHHSVCCKNSASSCAHGNIDETPEGTRRTSDPYIINGDKTITKQYLSKLSLQKIKGLVPFTELSALMTNKSDILGGGNITGLRCRTNKTLDFYYLDSVYHSVYMEKLSLPVPAPSNKASSVILVDMKNEAVHVLQKQLNYNNLGMFLQNFTQGRLRRHTRSSEVETPTECYTEPDSVCILEVTADTFQEVVMDNNKDVLLLYYTHWCGFCSVFTQTFLSVASYFSSNTDLVFARVNADLNDLPWEFTVETFPSLIFFPAHRKADSVMFPEKRAKTVPNLIKFILHHSKFSLQLDTAVSMCSSQCIETNRQRILERISELETSMKQLSRRSRTLYKSKVLNESHSLYLTSAKRAVARTRRLKSVKLRKAKLLNHVLQASWKQMDRAQLMDLIVANREI